MNININKKHLPDQFVKPVCELVEAIKAKNPVNASRQLQNIMEQIYDDHPDADKNSLTDDHRDDVKFGNRNRASEFLSAIVNALEQIEDGKDKRLWLITARAEIEGFRTVVLDQTMKELGYSEVGPNIDA